MTDFLYRMKGVGICSGLGTIGGIVGIILGEYQKLPYSTTVIAVIGALTLITAFLIRVLPDITKEKMPKTFADLEKLQAQPESPQNNEP